MAFSVRLLGPVELRCDDHLLTLKGYKPLALLAYLLVTGQAHSREHLVDLLYDEADDPRRSLRWTLNQLRQTIGSDYLATDRQQIGFDFERDLWLDVDALAAGETEVYRGDFLEGIYIRDAHRFMDWAFFQRERLRSLYQQTLAENLAAHETRGQYETVIELGHRLIQLDNLREEWYRALMQAYALLGHRDAALAQYELCHQVLSVELGLEPSPETTALYEQIQAGTLNDPRGLADLPVQLPDFLKPESVPKGMEPPVFVAREGELARLSQFLERALAGQGQIAFIIGGAGQGKTALLTEFAARAQMARPDLLVASGNCDLYSGIGDPYLPFRDVLGLLTGDVARGLAAGTINFEQARRLWLNLLPACQAMLEHGQNLFDVLVPRRALLARARTAAPQGAHQLRPLAVPEATGASEIAQENLFQQVTNVLQMLAVRQPLLLLLDDLQWADATSISLLFHLARRLTGSRILMVGAYRPEEVAIGRGSERHPLEPVLAEVKRMRGNVWVDLGQNDEAEDLNFVEALLDAEPNCLGPAFRQALYRHTGGQPLFTIELLRAMQERGDIVQDGQGRWVEQPSLNWDYLPARVEAVIEERIGRLEEELRQALTVASVDGEEFTAQVVAQIQAMSERQLLGQLSQVLAKKHRLVRGRGEVQVGHRLLSRYQFAHALFQRYLYNELSPDERRLLHAEVGTVLEALYGDQAEQIAVQLAWHFQVGNVPDKARHFLPQAGRQAARQYANDEAVAYFSRALELAPEHALEERYELLFAREKVFDLQGERERQEQDLTALHNLAEAMDDDHKRAEVALRWSNFSEATSDYLTTISVARTAITLAQAVGDLNREAQGHLYWAQALWRQGDYDPARIQLDRALELAEPFAPLKARCLRTSGLVAWNQGDYGRARHYFEQSLLVFREISDRQGEGLSLNNLGIISALQGDNPGATAFFEQSLRLSRQIGDRQGEANVLNNLGIVAGHQGDYLSARGYYEQALPIKREIDDRQGQAMVLDNLGDVFRYQGDYARAQDYFEQSLAIRREIGDRRGEGNILNNLGNVADYQGDYGHAQRYYEQSLAIRREIGERQGEGEGLAYLSLLFYHLGQHEVALEYAEQALRIAQELGEPHLLGYTWTHLGHARVGLGHLQEAAAAYREALAIRRELGEHNRALEPLAGLARVALTEDDLPTAQGRVAEILSYLETHSLAGTEEPFRVYLTCYHVLRANQDPRAQDILQTAQHLLREQAAKISDEALRHSFLEKVVTHRELLSEFGSRGYAH